MSDHTIDPERAALITKRIGQAFAFARDVIDTPRMLDEIPDGSTLFFRDVEFQGEHVRLIAHPSHDRPDWWTARVSGPAPLASGARQWTSPRGRPETFLASGPTAKDALDALEQRLSQSDRPQTIARRASGE